MIREFIEIIESFKSKIFKNNLETFLKLLTEKELKHTVKYCIYTNKNSSNTIYSALVIYETDYRIMWKNI